MTLYSVHMITIIVFYRCLIMIAYFYFCYNFWFHKLLSKFSSWGFIFLLSQRSDHRLWINLDSIQLTFTTTFNSHFLDSFLFWIWKNWKSFKVTDCSKAPTMSQFDRILATIDRLWNALLTSPFLAARSLATWTYHNSKIMSILKNVRFPEY